MRILGVDFGDARTGYALSDPTGFLAGGIGTEKTEGIRKAVEITCRKAAETGAEKIVVGLPVNMNGTEGDRAARVRRFAGMVAQETGLPVELCDERRTTVMAAGYMSETGTFGKKRKQSIDTLSAQIILQTYLDKQKNQQNNEKNQGNR